MKSVNYKSILLTVFFFMTSTFVYAQTVGEPSTWQENQTIDLSMNTLAGPTWMPIYFDQNIGLSSPLYKQEPLAAQSDFIPSPEPMIDPVTTTNTPGSENSSGGGGSGSPQNPQDPPDVICNFSVFPPICN